MEEVCNVFSPAHRNDEVNIFESSPSNVPLTLQTKIFQGCAIHQHNGL